MRCMNATKLTGLTTLPTRTIVVGAETDPIVARLILEESGIIRARSCLCRATMDHRFVAINVLRVLQLAR